jgi:quercetin dioxygenase-like cupin family protein
MAGETGFRADMRMSAGDAASEILTSGDVRVEKVELSGDGELEWQRCPVSDRVFVVTSGSGYVFRAHGRDEVRDAVTAGDVVYLKRLVWHRLVTDGTLSGALVTSPPLEVEFRR